MPRTLATLAKSVAARILRPKLLSLPAGNSDALLPLRYTYRASPEGTVVYQFPEEGSGLFYTLYQLALSRGRPVRGEVSLSLELPAIERGDTLRVGLVERRAWINDTPISTVSANHQQSRKFVAELCVSKGPRRLMRQCSHYLPFTGKQIVKDYYFGDDYLDYPQQTDGTSALNLVRRYCSGGILLDVGCALGIYTKAFLDAGFDAYGVDVSEFAIREACTRVGHHRVRQCNLDLSGIPFDFSFDVFWMWDVLEHSADPLAMLEKVTAKASPGAWLFLETANAESLAHRILGNDWEAYSDYSHHGVDRVGATSLAQWLGRLGWQIADWKCTDVWIEGADPVMLRLQEAFRSIPELALLLSERDLGDFIQVVARRP